MFVSSPNTHYLSLHHPSSLQTQGLQGQVLPLKYRLGCLALLAEGAPAILESKRVMQNEQGLICLLCP